MQQCEERLLTFVNWPLGISVRPDQLAKAGFYYAGRNDDVKCFCCDGGLSCWVSGADPWVEHAKWFPRCEYLLQEKGREFVDQIQARFPGQSEQLLNNGDSNSRECVDPPVVHLGPGEDRSEDAVMMNNPVVKSALEMGFERGLVKQTVQSKILASGENYKTVQELVSDLLDHKKREEEREFLAEEMASDLPTEEQLRRLQEAYTCKVCMDKKVKIVFIPCGHLVVCEECAPSLRECPICRGLVQGAVRTFLS